MICGSTGLEDGIRGVLAGMRDVIFSGAGTAVDCINFLIFCEDSYYDRKIIL